MSGLSAVLEALGALGIVGGVMAAGMAPALIAVYFESRKARHERR